MKKIYYFLFTSFSKIILILLLLQGWLYHSSLHAQTNPNSATAGKEFYITYTKNAVIPPQVLGLELKVVVEKACYITAKYNNQASSYWYNWNNTWVMPGTYTQSVLYNDVFNGSTGISLKTITLTSTENVCVYAISYFTASTDATCILPVSAWGTEYRLATGAPPSFFPSYYAIVAHENNTSVTLHDNTIIPLLQKNLFPIYQHSTVAHKYNLRDLIQFQDRYLQGSVLQQIH